ncbi:MAG TPA: NAD-dependent epimerase/dehydratase family protein [Terriglobales bacterium]|nr:NAD-dependent epimerase/dehydratase family protein [Terriglobales bacterium]
MGSASPTVVVTGVAGNLGLRLLPQLAGFDVLGVDFKPPKTSLPLRFERMDLGTEESCRELLVLLRDVRAVALIHLAFVLDPVRTGVLDLDHMWRINVAGIARIMEAISEANRYESMMRKLIVPSSVAVYGPSLPAPVSEDAPMAAHSLPYAVHKMEAEKVIQQRAPGLRGCSVYVLRPHIYAGATMENYMVGAFRGTPNGQGKRAERMRNRGKRLPCILPMGRRYLENRIQFVHVDDMARLMSYIVQRTEPEPQRITVLNVAGRGEPLTFRRCIEIAHARLRRVPGKWAFRMTLELLWESGISAIPPQAAPYMIGEYIMKTDKLREYLGKDYEKVIRYTIAEAFEDCFAPAAQRTAAG